ncbi:MAG: restriction endonuclease subunit S [Syntrophales bacterium]|jgi:type I restriction enzyme S subunit|nr:restriction endonuclease subunit S [Syntrophales bacterium]
MGNNWHCLPFTEAVTVNPSVSLNRGDVYPFVEMKAVEPSQRGASESEFREFKGGGARFFPYDTLMARITPCLENGKIAQYIPSSDVDTPAFGSTEFIVIRGRDGVTDNNYAYYLTQWKEFRCFAISQMTGSSGRQRVPVDSLVKFIAPIPEKLNEQRAIAHILGTLDDKIELNRRMNQTLEAMARVTYKSWFVDFDPVRAKAEGRPTGLPNDIAALFPESFENSELGEIPKGWRVLPLSEIVNIIGGGTPKIREEEYWGGDIPWFSVVDAPSETDVFVIDTEKHITQLGVDKSSTKLLRKGTTIISARGTVGKCGLVGRSMAMNQSCYGIQGKNGESDYFVYFTIRRQVSDLQRSGHGSVFNTITRDTFKTIRIACPPPNLTIAYEETINPFMESVLASLHENATLASLRDALLPKLISGELRIPDAEKFVEEAGV